MMGIQYTFKDLKVKGTSTTLKRGTVVKNIKLTSNDEEIDCRVGKVPLILTHALDKQMECSFLFSGISPMLKQERPLYQTRKQYI